MEKFDRIVREALVMGGQARIRDTGITVNEIVRLSLDGKSQAEILAQYPVLEAEDVHQAMGWYMRTFRVLNLSMEMRTPMTAIIGYARLGQILISNKDENIEELQEMLKIIEQNTEYIAELWDEWVQREREIYN